LRKCARLPAAVGWIWPMTQWKDTFLGSFESLGIRGHLVNFGQSSGSVEPVEIAKLAAKSNSVTRPILFHYLVYRNDLEWPPPCLMPLHKACLQSTPARPASVRLALVGPEVAGQRRPLFRQHRVGPTASRIGAGSRAYSAIRTQLPSSAAGDFANEEPHDDHHHCCLLGDTRWRQGLARDIRVGWALEELEQPCGCRTMRCPGGRDHMDVCCSTPWNRRSLNSEPPGSWRATRPGIRSAGLCLVEDRVRDRLDHVTSHLGDADWLDGPFSAGDLIVVSVLLRLKLSGILNEYPNLAACVARGEARPVYKRAFDAQLAVNIGAPPTAN
jgi:hypothetical protein